MRTRTYLIAGALLATGLLRAQGPGEIRGKVLDSAKKPVEFANVVVRLVDGAITDETDSTGLFIIKPLQSGSYTVSITSFGLAPVEITGVEVQSDRITKLPETILASIPKELTGIRVKATRHPWVAPMIDMDHPERLTFVASKLKNDPNRRDPVKMISTLAPTMYKSPNSDEIYFKGSRAENMAYYVDGVKVTTGLKAISPMSIASVSVYTGGLPARYGDVTGGVISIETKSFSDLWLERQLALEAEAEAAAAAAADTVPTTLPPNNPTHYTLTSIMLLRRKAIVEDTDEVLVLRIREGDRASIGVLWDRYAHLLFGTGLKYLKNADASKDEVMELFASLPALLRTHHVEQFRAWVHTVMRNRCLQVLRKQGKVIEHTIDEQQPDANGTDDRVLQEATLQQLEQAITQLNDGQRLCIQAFYLERKSYAEVAERSGFSVEQVRSHLQNGRRNLKLMLQQHVDQHTQ